MELSNYMLMNDNLDIVQNRNLLVQNLKTVIMHALGWDFALMIELVE